MNEEQIIRQFQELKKNRDIILENGIDKKTFMEIINKRYTAEELEFFKIQRSRERMERRKNKYYLLYQNDEKYRNNKKKQALIRYYIKKHNQKKYVPDEVNNSKSFNPVK